MQWTNSKHEIEKGLVSTRNRLDQLKVVNCEVTFLGGSNYLLKLKLSFQSKSRCREFQFVPNGENSKVRYIAQICRKHSRNFPNSRISPLAAETVKALFSLVWITFWNWCSVFSLKHPSVFQHVQSLFLLMVKTQKSGTLLRFTTNALTTSRAIVFRHWRRAHLTCWVYFSLVVSTISNLNIEKLKFQRIHRI